MALSLVVLHVPDHMARVELEDAAQSGTVAAASSDATASAPAEPAATSDSAVSAQSDTASAATSDSAVSAQSDTASAATSDSATSAQSDAAAPPADAAAPPADAADAAATDSAPAEAESAPESSAESSAAEGGGDAAETFSVSASIQPEYMTVHHLPDPQAMPDAALIKKTIQDDAAAISRVQRMVSKVRRLRLNSREMAFRWQRLLDNTRHLDWDVLDEIVDNEDLSKRPGKWRIMSYRAESTEIVIHSDACVFGIRTLRMRTCWHGVCM
jgi:hypothetical protein